MRRRGFTNEAPRLLRSSRGRLALGAVGGAASLIVPPDLDPESGPAWYQQGGPIPLPEMSSQLGGLEMNLVVGWPIRYGSTVHFLFAESDFPDPDTMYLTAYDIPSRSFSPPVQTGLAPDGYPNRAFHSWAPLPDESGFLAQWGYGGVSSTYDTVVMSLDGAILSRYAPGKHPNWRRLVSVGGEIYYPSNGGFGQAQRWDPTGLGAWVDTGMDSLAFYQISLVPDEDTSTFFSFGSEGATTRAYRWNPTEDTRTGHSELPSLAVGVRNAQALRVGREAIIWGGFASSGRATVGYHLDDYTSVRYPDKPSGSAYPAGFVDGGILYDFSGGVAEAFVLDPAAALVYP